MLSEIAANPDFDVVANERALIDRYNSQQDPEYSKEVAGLAASAGQLPEGIRAVLAVPSYHEAQTGTLEKTFAQYGNLNNQNEVAVVVLENQTAGQQRDNTAKVLAKMQTKYPNLRIVPLFKEFKEKPSIGLVRKVLVDTILRILPPKAEQLPIIISNDADVEQLDPAYVQSHLNALQNNPRADVSAASYDLPADIVEKSPMLATLFPLMRNFRRTLRQESKKPSTNVSGANFAFRPGIYAAIGGFDEAIAAGEDNDFGKRVAEARRGSATIVRNKEDAAIITTDPRRIIASLLPGESLAGKHRDFATNERVRTAPRKYLLEKIAQINEDEFVRQIQAIYERFKKPKHSGELTDDKYDKAFIAEMEKIGIPCSVQKGLVVVETHAIEKLKTK
jgi:hypothetical protein